MSTSVPGGHQQSSFLPCKRQLQSRVNGGVSRLSCSPALLIPGGHSQGRTLYPGPAVNHGAHTHVVLPKSPHCHNQPYLCCHRSPFGPGDRAGEHLSELLTDCLLCLKADTKAAVEKTADAWSPPGSIHLIPGSVTFMRGGAWGHLRGLERYKVTQIVTKGEL